MKLFTEHPASVGETYAQHLNHAAGFGFAMVCGGLACLLHAVLPFTFVSTGSRTIAGLHDRMVVNRRDLTARRAGTAAIDGERSAV